MIKNRIRGVRLAALCAGAAALLAGSLGSATDEPPHTTSKGNTEKGEMRFQLRRGASVPFEITVIPTPQDCQSTLDVRLEWDEAQNWVRLRMKGKNALFPNPSVDRTEGVNYFPNPFWPEPVDFENGRYQLWIIMLGEPMTFYYDLATLDLLGSEIEFPTPPPNALPLKLPVGNVIPTDFIYPKPNGDVDFTQEWEYDRMVRGDLPDYSHIVATYIPHNLCQAHPYKYWQSTTRPWTSRPLPASEAPSFDQFLRAGLAFDLTVEPPEYFVFPPIVTNVATLSQVTNVGGQIPPGWTLDFDAVFGSVAPPIAPFGGAGSCEDYFKPVHERDFNMCTPPQGG